MSFNRRTTLAQLWGMGTKVSALSLLTCMGASAFAADLAGERLTFTEGKVVTNQRLVDRFFARNEDLESLSEFILVPGQVISKVIDIGDDPNARLQLVTKWGGADDEFFGLVERSRNNRIVADSIPLRVNGELIIPARRDSVDISTSLVALDAGTDAGENGIVNLANPFRDQFSSLSALRNLRVSLHRVPDNDSQLVMTIRVPKQARHELYEVVYGVSSGENLLYTLGEEASPGLQEVATSGITDELREELLLELDAAGVETGVVGGVYSLTNAVAGNAVAVFDRYIDGSLEYRGAVDADGFGYELEGTNFNPLDSQSSIITSDFGQFVVGVSAGSDEVFVMRVNRDTNEVTLADKASSNGEFPVSVAMHNDLLFVLNDHSSNISGFRVSPEGQLEPIVNSSRSMGPGGESPVANAPERDILRHEIAFTPDGSKLVVVESGTNSDVIHVFAVDEDGVPSERVTSLADSENPLAIAFSANGKLLITESADDESVNAVTSYNINDDLTLSIITPAVPNFQEASCWLIGYGNVFYTVNSLTNNFSSYEVTADGEVSLIDVASAQLLQGPPPVFDDGFLDVETLEMTLANGTAPPFPTDAVVSTGGRFMYSLNLGNSTISGFAIQPDGSLAFIADYEGEIVPFGGGQGMAAR